MNAKSLDVLDFEEIRTMLVRETLTPMGRDLAMATYPCAAREARERQVMVAEISRLSGGCSFSFLSGMPDPRPVLDSVFAGAVLSVEGTAVLLRVFSAMETLRSCLVRLDAAQFPRLRAAGNRIPCLKKLVEVLDRTVTPEGEMKDSASETLRRIRREIARKREEIRKAVESLARSPAVTQYLQDPSVHFRNGRYVLPVKQEYAMHVPGIIHDQSGTGQTVYIEPLAAVEMWNQLRKLELDERDEIDRILGEITRLVRSEPQTRDAVAAVGEVDYALARAALMDRWRGVLPEIGDEPKIILRGARHPLIRGDPVPLDVTLESSGTAPRTLVITGPNMGGKTVALKTIGLTAAMALSGLPVPAGPGTVVGAISDILVDIGDEQSIAENLSTFSAHIRNMVSILEAAGPDKLVLIDELGAGTDPHEGAALGMAILKHLHSTGAISVVTTHYSELKTFAHETPGMENASMEWDAVNMVPTYRLIVGRPGRSNALDVARRCGLPREIVEEARELMPQDLVRLEDLVREMEIKERQTEEQLVALRRETETYRKLRAEMEELVRTCDSEKREIIARARQEAREIVRRVRVETEALLKEARKMLQEQASKESLELVRSRLEAVRNSLEEREVDASDIDDSEPVPISHLSPGQYVKVRGFTEPGRILEPPGQGGMVLVQVGSVTVRTRISDLAAMSLPAESRTSGTGQGALKAARSTDLISNARTEVDIRGLRVEEALAVLDKFLDDAYLAGLKTVRVIHGKGTGVLRKAVMEFVRGHPHVSDARIADLSQGGHGVTLVELRD